LTHIEQTSLCDKEPIHLLSQIRQNGYLFVLSYDNFKILQVSDNIFNLTNQLPEHLLNDEINNVFDIHFTYELSKSILYIKENNKQFNTFTANINDKTLFCVVHAHNNDFFILEIENITYQNEQTFTTEDSINNIIQNCDFKVDLTAFLQRIVNAIQTISGYDRVMLYKFDDNFNGTVLAQATDNMHENFLGHRFPASDIPVQARALYLKNRFRVIGNVNDTSSNITPLLNPVTNSILDMTYCYFRSVSKLHIQYLKNMGVEASMSLSIIVNNKLWGLVACHHDKPKHIPIHQYQTYYLLSHLISSQIEQKELIKYYENTFDLKAKRELLISFLQNDEENSFIQAIQKYKEILGKTLECDDCVIYHENRFICANDIFNDTQLLLLLLISKEHLKNNLFVSSNLGNEYPKLSKIKRKLGGIITIKIPNIEDTFLMFIRSEQVYTIKWAGEKSKKVEYDNNGLAIINPRASFESWKEVVKGTCEQFTKEEIDSTINLAEELSTVYNSYSINQESKKLKRLNAKLQNQANTDPLTLLYNQRYFKEFGMLYFVQNQKKNNDFSLLLIDIDNLKITKELYGNEICDLLIVTVAHNTKKEIPETSLLSRVGCEEFAIILCDTNLTQSLAIANSIKKKLENCYVTIGEDKIYPKLSMGISQYNQSTFKTFSQMLRATEIKLSLAQESGGNIISS
jgi:two-component system, chemotaxis family, sensor kinase Cph1